jgi:subtilisin-like proprotein convertase family protein
VRSTILYILIFLCFQATAQSGKKNQKRVAEHKGHSIELPRLDLAHIRSNVEDKRGSHQFAERRDVELTHLNSGQWIQKGEFWEWSLDIQSPGAISMNLGFTEYQLPESATLSIFNSKGHKLGPFTKSDNKDHHQLWTPILKGDKVTLKLKVPKTSIEDVKLKLSAVNHGFALPELRSGSCNIDVACIDNEEFPMIRQFADQIQSVAVVQLNGGRTCSGFLINTTQNDFQPYFLTAAHCEINSRNAATTVFYWNYENSTCREADSIESGEIGDGSLSQFNMGSSFISGTTNLSEDFIDVDFTLLMLDEPVNPDFEPYFAGWDIRPIIPESTTAIHHPNVEEKRISFDFDPPSFEVVNSDSVFVRVENWELGTTERGSSGSPLFNQDGRVIGHLSGGEASCFNDLFDRFGWIGLAWNNGDSEQTRLRDWLDPSNSGIQFIDGIDGSFSIQIDQKSDVLCGVQNATIQREITVDDNFGSTVQLSIQDFPFELNPSLEKDQLSPGESTILTLDNVDALTTGVYQVTLQATDGTNENTNDFTFEIVENVPGTIVPEFPANNQSLGGSLASFRWQGSADDYEIQISENIEFVSPIVEESVLLEPQFSTSSLNESAEYYWRVRGTNLCGQSAWSDPIKFKTTSLSCTEVMEDSLSLEITPNRNDTVEAQITIDLTSPIESVTIPRIAGTHTWSSDLKFSLISPIGTEVLLTENQCSAAQFMDFTLGFSDAGFPLSSLPCPFTDGRIYEPESPLGIFNGENPNGIWTLRITDAIDFDGGALESFHLEICTASTGQLFTQFTESTFDACGLSQIESSFQISNDFESDVQITTVSVNENLTVSLNDNIASPGQSVNYTISNIDQLEDMTSSIRFLFASGEKTTESIVELNFESELPSFNLMSPINNSIFKTEEDLAFDWEDVSGATGYILEISLEDITFSDPISIDFSPDQSFFESMSDAISPDPDLIDVFWRVIALGEDCDRISPTSMFILDLTSGINELGDLTITILPNPFQSDIRIDFSEPTSDEFIVDLFDARGSRLKSNRLQSGSNQFNLDTSDVPPGIYFLRMQSELGVIVEKVVKQR